MRILLTLFLLGSFLSAKAADSNHFLYVGAPGVRNDLAYGGHGVLVFDMDHGHRFVKRIAAGGLGGDGKPLNVKGICASAATQRLYVSTTETMTCFDLHTDAILWENHYDGGCDRMSITPDGAKLFTPSLEKNFWHVINAATGEDLARIPSERLAHNTIVSLGGSEAYLADRGSRLVEVVDTRTNQIARKLGPFGNFVRPFTVNGRATLLYANVDALLGFEIADIKTGTVLHRVTVPGFTAGSVKRHGCPSHGIGLTPDEREVWVTDATNKRMHIFDNSAMPPVYRESIELRDEPGWVTFSLDGKFGYPSTGDVVDAATHKVITALKDETGAAVQSEKMVEVQLDAAGRVTAAGDQFGLGRVR